MKKRVLNTGLLSLENLKAKPVRTACLVVITAILSFTLFGGSILALNLRQGLSAMTNRFGADLMVVPAGSSETAQSILLRGAVSYFYFDVAIFDRVARTTPSGFWDTTIRWRPGFQEAPAGWIPRSFMTMNTMRLLIGRAHAEGYDFLADQEREMTRGSVSVVLAKTKPSAPSALLAQTIDRENAEVDVVVSQSIFFGISEALGGLTAYIHLFSVVLWVLALIVLAAVFSGSTQVNNIEYDRGPCALGEVWDKGLQVVEYTRDGDPAAGE
ncbi:MAG: hypothetical protein LBT93_04625 [Treponema sp.]|jgi:hypothetical protein|nr:hypothetical protein [Treponema sp.]